MRERGEHTEHGVDHGAVVAQAGHLALPSEFSGGGEPAVEESAGHGRDRKRVEENSAGALGLIVAVLAAEVAVEQHGEFLS